jgi:nucleotide-binding universal stress UspA family protein
MFKHILIPIDGTEFSDRAIDAGVRFAKSIDARITGFIAEPEYKIPTHGEIVSRTSVSMYEHSDKARAHAESVLKRMGEKAHAEGVKFDAAYVENDRPVDAIVEAAEKHACDLILMASHGRRGLDKLLHGSAAEGVLKHTQVPVLVMH